MPPPFFRKPEGQVLCVEGRKTDKNHMNFNEFLMIFYHFGSGGLGLRFVSPPSLFAIVMVGVFDLFCGAARVRQF